MRSRRPAACLALAALLAGLLAPAHGIAHRFADARLALLGGWCLPSGLPAPAPAIPASADHEHGVACCAAGSGTAGPPPVTAATPAVAPSGIRTAAAAAPPLHLPRTARPTARAPPA